MNQEAEIEAVKEARRRKFESLGIKPTFSEQQVTQASNASATYGVGNSATRDRINKIKNGMMKETMLHLNTAENPNAFQAIPEGKPKTANNRNNPNAQSAKKVDVAPAPVVKVSKEAMEYEAMFDTDNRSSYRGDVVMGNQWEERRQNAANQPIISNDYMERGPDFVNEFIQKKQNWQQAEQHNNQQPHYSNNEQSAVGPTQIRNMVENIAHEVVIRKVKEAMLEISNIKKQNENALTYKKVKNQKGELLNDHIMIGGIIYKIQEVKRK